MENQPKTETPEERETRLAYMKNYYQTHKKKLLDYGNKKIECENCGRIVLRNNIRRHYNSHLCKPKSSLQ